MPELPEVEVTRQGLIPHVEQQQIQQVIVRRPNLRYLIPQPIYELAQQTIQTITRRSKYLQFHVTSGTFLLHLGMSGHVKILPNDTPASAHDHIDWCLGNQKIMRYHDPRRFGYLLWQPLNEQHEKLKKLGPEPLTDAFDSFYLLSVLQKRKRGIKASLMDNNIVVGIGNIYASEILFLSRIHPQQPSNSLTIEQLSLIVDHSKQVLTQAIKQGGTTLKDFAHTDGKPGYFAQHLFVYGRQHQACYQCDTLLQACTVGGRSSVFCPQCQPLHLS